jgi:four helix bundle protein
MAKTGFKELRVWQKGKDLAVYIYQITNTGDFAQEYGLRDQIRRAAVSIPSNIVEGDDRERNR